jgi:hypothetical protein
VYTTATTDFPLLIFRGLSLALEDKLLLMFDWLRLLNVPFVKSSGPVSLIVNCSILLEYTKRISFETPSAIVPLRYVVRLAAKLISLISLPYLSIKDGFGSNKE